MSGLPTLTLIAALAMPAALQQTMNTPVMSASDFIMKAADAGMKEVEISKMAIERASNEDVKALARRLVTDHSKANEELRDLAKSKNVTLKMDPTMAMKSDPSKPPGSMAGDHHAAHASLMALQGAAFDKAYVDQMVKDHAQAVEMFDKQSDDGEDKSVKDWAEKTLPTLREHLKMAKDLQEKIK